METRYQRIAREQAERLAVGAAKRDAVFKTEQKRIRAERRALKAQRNEIDNLDHDYSMNA